MPVFLSSNLVRKLNFLLGIYNNTPGYNSESVGRPLADLEHQPGGEAMAELLSGMCPSEASLGWHVVTSGQWASLWFILFIHNVRFS